MISRFGFFVGYIVQAFAPRKLRPVPRVASTPQELCRKVTRYSGLYSTVARELGVSRQFVFQVAKGIRPAPYVREAIAKEIERRDGGAR